MQTTFNQFIEPFKRIFGKPRPSGMNAWSAYKLMVTMDLRGQLSWIIHKQHGKMESLVLWQSHTLALPRHQHIISNVSCPIYG